MSTILAQRVRAAADKQGIAALLKRSKVSKSQLYSIMRGESQGRGGTLKALAAAGVDLDGLFNGKRKVRRYGAAPHRARSAGAMDGEEP